MDISSLYNSQIDIQSLLNGVGQTKNANSNNITNQTANYAEKGEPMYMEDMDSDKDGVVTLDEFRNYCKEKNINSNAMMKMSKAASSYRVMKAEESSIDNISKLIPNVHPNLKQTESKSGFLKQTENQYNISNDPNKTKNVSYQEYMKYCQQNTTANNLKTNTKVENSQNGAFKVSSSGKAVNSYKNSESNALRSTFEKEV